MFSQYPQFLNSTEYLSTAFWEPSPLQMVLMEEEEGGDVFLPKSKKSKIQKRVFVNPGPWDSQPAEPGYFQVSLVNCPQSAAASETLARQHDRDAIHCSTDTYLDGNDDPPGTTPNRYKPNAMVDDPSCNLPSQGQSTDAVPGGLRGHIGSRTCRKTVYPSVLHLPGSHYHSYGGPGDPSLDTQQPAGVGAQQGVEHKAPTPTSREWHILKALARLEGWNPDQCR